MAFFHINVFILAFVGMLGWLDLLIRGSHTRLGIVSMLLIPPGFWLFLSTLCSYPNLRGVIRYGTTIDVVLIAVMFGIGVGATLGSLRHGHKAYLVYGWVMLMLWWLLLNPIMFRLLSTLVNYGDWSPGWHVVLLLENVLVVIAAIYISVTAKRAYDQRTFAMEGLCPSCGYDLQGSADALNCPECGHDIKSLTA